jgi:hypothetical protein
MLTLVGDTLEINTLQQYFCKRATAKSDQPINPLGTNEPAVIMILGDSIMIILKEYTMR